MLGVAIVLPSVDNYTDVNFGVRLLTGTYDQGWNCRRKNGGGQYSLEFADTDPSNNGKLIRDICKNVTLLRPVCLLSHKHM